MMKVVRPLVAFSKASCNCRSGLGIERRARLVEDHDRRIFEKRAGDGEPLAFAAGKGAAAFADMVARPSLWLATKSSACARASACAISAALASSLPIFRFSSIERANNIGSWKTTPILRRKSGERHVADVDSIDLDLPSLRVEDAMQEAERRRLAGAGSADERDRSGPAPRRSSRR